MLSITIITSLLLGISWIQSSIAQPVNASSNASSFILNHAVSDYFPDAKGDLSPFDVNVQYIGYDPSVQSWLSTLDPSTAASDEEKAMRITEAAYAKPFDPNDPDMTENLNSLLAAVAGNATTLQRRDPSTFALATQHGVKWAACAAFFSCVSGATCAFSLNIGEAPRSQCQSQGGESCCISWSDYSVRAGFFSITWTTCDNEADAANGMRKRDAGGTYSCEGYGGQSQGGDICLSNRASGCT